MNDWDNDEEYDFDEDFLEELEEEFEELEKSNLQFEIEFYSILAGTKKFQVLNIPDEDGYIPSAKDTVLLRKQVNSAGMELLYRVSVGKHAVVFSPNSELIGIVPENNSNGFSC